MNGPERTPGSMLEVYMHALAGKTNDDFLDEINLGVGNYGEAEYWQQVQAFRDGLFANSAMARKIVGRAKLETQRALVNAIFQDEDSELLKNVDYRTPREDESKHEYFEEEAENIWLGGLGADTEERKYTPQEHQAYLINQVTGLSPNWVPPQWRMLKMRHEASRSKEARLIDNLFGRPPEPDMVAMQEFEP